MAYTSGVFRIDLVSGSDTARTALTSCTASNPSGSTTRINKTAHGLVTGAVVDLTLFTAWLNDAWKVTVVDADNFDLDGATWQSTADTSGTVTPRGGSSWTDAWLTVNTGATAARIQPGDEIRFSKTADPVSLGQNATWTDGSQTVTLTTAVTKKIEDAISGWTGAANVTVATNTNRKMGATSVQIAPAAAFTTGKLCYKTIDGGGSHDFSGYRYINFWMRSASGGISANTYKICLCSDTTGDTIVNEINIPNLTSSTAFQIMVLDYGGALSSGIQSVSIHCLVDPGASPVTFFVNNIFASNGDLSLKTLIGKTGDVNYNIQSIDGTTIKIDSNNMAATGRGYSGATSTETLYYLVPFDVTTTGTWATINEAGNTLMPYNHYIGGYNTSNDTRDGVTVLASTIMGTGTVFGVGSGNFSKFSYFTLARFGAGMSTFSISDFNNIIFCGGQSFLNISSFSNSIYTSFKILNCSAAQAMGSKVKFIQCEFRNNSASAISAYPYTDIISCTFANNGTSSILVAGGSPYLRNCTLSDSTEITYSSNVFVPAFSINHDDTLNNNWIFDNGATINWQTATFHGSEPGAWKFIITSSTRTSYKPVTLKIAEVACAASALVTVKAWVKKDHATNVAAQLYVLGELYTIGGVAADDATKASDTSWEELTITFTPTEAGVVPIYVDAWYVAGASNVYVGTITITQA